MDDGHKCRLLVLEKELAKANSLLSKMQHQRNAITATVHLGPEHEHHPVDMQPMGASDRAFIDVHATDTQRPARFVPTSESSGSDSSKEADELLSAWAKYS